MDADYFKHNKAWKACLGILSLSWLCSIDQGVKYNLEWILLLIWYTTETKQLFIGINSSMMSLW